MINDMKNSIKREQSQTGLSFAERENSRATLKKMMQWVMAATLTLCSFDATAQTLRGTVKDIITGEPLPGATVTVVGQQGKSATADANGNFEINGLPVSRYTIEARFVGYEPERIVEVLAGSKKETVIAFQLRELTKQLQEVTVRPAVNKARAINPTAVAGATMISVEEADRFGGNFDDIGRVVRRYVGTTGSVDNTSISTHGNPASMTMYRLEGVEAPAPVHADEMGGHGTGQISALHTNLLANSDYYTAAAPAELGNTMGGVMDLKLRNGNPNTYEHSVKLSTIGLDATSEGPLSKKNGSSYLVSYRYGLTKLLNDMGVTITAGDQLEYTDLLMKLNFPLSSQATFSLWGLATWDKNYQDWDGLDETWNTLYDQKEDKFDTKTVTGGATLDLGLGQGWRLRTDLAAAYRDFSSHERYAIYATDGTLLTEENRKVLTFAPVTPFSKEDNKTLWLTASVAAQKRFSSHYLLKFGSSLRHIDYTHSFQRATSVYTGMLLPVNDADETMQQVDAYATNNLRFGRWTFNAGLHLSGWTLSNDWTLQPRLSTEWKPADDHTLSFGYGMTTRTDAYDTYFAADINRDLKPMRSHQLVFNYKWQPRQSLCFSTEAWAEFQSAVPVSPTSTYCSLNRLYWYTTEALVSNGRARNYGVAMGVEHYMTDGFYWLLNGALYKSEYRAIDQIWRPTRFDRGWTVNAVGGKEWKVKNRHILSVNIAATAMGGLRHTPFDEAGSAAFYAVGSPYVAYDETRTMADRTDPVIDLSLNITYRIHGKKFDQIIGLDYMDILASEEPYLDYYNYHTHKPQIVDSYLSVPNISYAIVF